MEEQRRLVCILHFFAYSLHTLYLNSFTIPLKARPHILAATINICAVNSLVTCAHYLPAAFSLSSPVDVLIVLDIGTNASS
jgi:hypothetical protein